MYFDLSNTDTPHDVYSLLTGGIIPRPIAWVSSQSSAGVANLAPYSFFTVASLNPPVLSISQINPQDRRAKDTLLNLQDNGECVVNIVSGELVAVMNATCANYPHNISEFSALNITQVPSMAISPPGVRDSRVRYECRLREILTISDQPSGGTLMLLNIVGIYVDDDVYVDGAIDPDRLNAVGKMGGDYYATTLDKIELARPAIKF